MCVPRHRNLSGAVAERPHLMTHRRRFLFAAASGTAALTIWPLSAASQAASKTARLVVPFPPGGGTDAVARLIAERLRAVHPGGLIVENKPGASARLGVELVKASEPDGSTMLFTPDFVMTIYPYTYRKLGYDPIADFAPVALCAKTAYALVGGPALPPAVTDFQQFVSWCKANPRQAAFASTSAGGASHFLGLMMSRAIGVELLHVPYKGGAPALQDLMGGQIPVSINPIGEVLPHVKTGRLRVFATTGATRSRFMSNVPTLKELGLPEMVVEAWLGLFTPAKTPADTVTRLSSQVNSALLQADLKTALEAFGMEAVQSTPAGFAGTIKEEMERWRPVVRASGFTADD
jgi:tripartite-type tricarboxylate transporter receptor subunit TctC